MALATELSYLPGPCTVRPSDKEAESPLEATAKLFGLCRNNDLPILLVGGGLELGDPLHVVTLRPAHALIWLFRF